MIGIWRWFTQDNWIAIIFIALGIAIAIFRPLSRADVWLQGMPDSVMTVILAGLAIAVLAVALLGRPGLKALMILWVLLP